MSTNGGKPKRRTSRRIIPLLMIGNDGELYACAPADGLPKGVVQNKHTLVAVRLTHQQRGLALKALQVGVVAASKILTGFPGRKLDS
jgi:hypothetical protein